MWLWKMEVLKKSSLTNWQDRQAKPDSVVRLLPALPPIALPQNFSFCQSPFSPPTPQQAQKYPTTQHLLAVMYPLHWTEDRAPVMSLHSPRDGPGATASTVGHVRDLQEESSVLSHTPLSRRSVSMKCPEQANLEDSRFVVS